MFLWLTTKRERVREWWVQLYAITILLRYIQTCQLSAKSSFPLSFLLLLLLLLFHSLPCSQFNSFFSCVPWAFFTCYRRWSNTQTKKDVHHCYFFFFFFIVSIHPIVWRHSQPTHTHQHHLNRILCFFLVFVTKLCQMFAKFAIHTPTTKKIRLSPENKDELYNWNVPWKTKRLVFGEHQKTGNRTIQQQKNKTVT